jgi:hypothetical protein
MSNTRHTAAPQRPTRRSTAVIAQYIQDLSQTARVRPPRQPLRPREPRAFPARVVPLPCA